MCIRDRRQKQVDDALAAAETSKKEAATALNTAQDKLRNVDAEAAARRTAYEEQAEKEMCIRDRDCTRTLENEMTMFWMPVGRPTRMMRADILASGRIWRGVTR